MLDGEDGRRASQYHALYGGHVRVALALAELYPFLMGLLHHWQVPRGLFDGVDGAVRPSQHGKKEQRKARAQKPHYFKSNRVFIQSEQSNHPIKGIR